MKQPFDPMDTLLREALDSDAVPSADFTERVMARVSDTSQEKPVRPAYRKWLAAAAACAAVLVVAVPLLRGVGSDSSADTACYDDAANGAVADQEDSLAVTDGADTDGVDMKVCSRETEDAEAAPAAMEERLACATELLAQQGYTLEITAETDTAVQVIAVDECGGEDGQPALRAAMTAAGFVEQDGWYVLEDTVS